MPTHSPRNRKVGCDPDNLARGKVSVKLFMHKYVDFSKIKIKLNLQQISSGQPNTFCTRIIIRNVFLCQVEQTFFPTKFVQGPKYPLILWESVNERVCQCNKLGTIFFFKRSGKPERFYILPKLFCCLTFNHSSEFSSHLVSFYLLFLSFFPPYLSFFLLLVSF